MIFPLFKQGLLRQRGFTLVELVMTMVVATVLATVSVQFIRSSSEGFIASNGRQQLASAGYVVNEQISRALRDALPGSIRTTADNLCVEFMPVVAASMYTDLSVGSDITSFRAAPYSVSQAASGYVSVYPISSANLYAQNDPGPITPDIGSVPAGNVVVDVTLASGHTFPADSPERRYYLSSAPETICQDGAYLYRYRGYGFISDVANLKAALPTNFAGGRSVLAFPLQANSMTFRFQNPTLARNGLVAFEYILQHPTTGETLTLGQQVRVVNVP
ncbi:MAG: MSHA biogenesis protein MshO [Thalassolituus sp.]|jgi:MSHA biogenesis protein MshO|nr:type II secretion system protein [Pseudomonadota bacterium]TNC86717.1 MAG: MSHA biogenesis protein MshO [Thalassolituus sp.]